MQTIGPDETQARGASAPRASFIVPAYNMAAFIGDTLTSLQVQTLSDFEALVIDDGSTDDTADLVRTVADADPRFHLLHGTAEGPGAARNLGLAKARGELVVFVDADDLIHPRYLDVVSTARARSSDDDVLVLPFVRGTEVRWPKTVSSDVVTVPAVDVAARGKAIWRLVATRAFLERTGVRFLNTRNYEDAVATTEIVNHARRLVELRSPVYFYRSRTDSLIKRRGPQRTADALRAVEALTAIRSTLPAGTSAYLTDLARMKVVIGQYRLLPRGEQRPFLRDALDRASLTGSRSARQALDLCLRSRGQWLRPTLAFTVDALSLPQ